MKTHVSLLLLFLTALPALAQVSAPQVPMTGNIGSGGTFPLFNHGTISMNSDGDYTMNPTGYEMTATTLRVTSTVTLTAPRNVIHPSVALGFLVSVENTTTGGQSIIFKGPTGTGATIPNGQTIMVMSDGTNYVSVGGGLADPGANGIVKRTALNVTAPAVGGTDYLRPTDVSAAPGVGFIYQTNTSTPAGMTSVNPTGTKCYVFGGSGGLGCDTPSAGPTTRTWRYPFQGICQGGAASSPVIFDTTNAPSYVVCSAGTLIGEFQTTASTTTNIWYVRFLVPPGVVNNTYAITLVTRTADTTTTDSDIITPTFACLTDGILPITGTGGLAFSAITGATTITLHPQGTANAQITSVTSNLTMACAAGNSIYIKFNPSTVAYTINFAYIGIDVQGTP